MASVREFVRNEWDVLLGMLGITTVCAVLLTWLFAVTGVSWAAVLADPLATFLVALIIAIECGIIWLTSRL